LALPHAFTKLNPDKAGQKAKPVRRSSTAPQCLSGQWLWISPGSRKNVDQYFEEIIMKKLAFIAFAALATTAFAGPPGPLNGPQIVINGSSVQGVAMIFSSLRNQSTGSNSDAHQNVSSNSGNVTVNGNSTQLTAGIWSDVSNRSTGSHSYASQNLSSNVGKVDINGSSTQVTAMLGSYVANLASGNHATAVQNIASNNGCTSCQPLANRQDR
jgi:hypothetical protein